jgi:hypothetical protein
MPHNGETNRKLGFYKSLCCEKEIVVPEGDLFPDCPNHLGVPTFWEPIVNENIVPFGKPRTSAYLTPRFHVGDRVIFVGVGAHKRIQGGVVGVIECCLDNVHRYQVRLSEGSWIRCFGFELEPVRKESKTA